MRISRVKIHNFRNIKNADVVLDDVAAIVGENNSGKTNFLKAITLPLISDEGDNTKRLSWYDINRDAKNTYYDFIKDNREKILNGSLESKELMPVVPFVSVELEITADDDEHYDVKDILSEDDEGHFVGRIKYKFYVKDLTKLLEHIKPLLLSNENPLDIGRLILNKRMSILPIELFSYEITIPDKETKISYDVLRRFRYVFLSAERDSFSSSSERIGSKSLIDLLQNNLSPKAQGAIEEEYQKFFNTIREQGKMDDILNWQQYSEIKNAKEFFEQITICPNMPSMNGILGSVRLGYGDDVLSSQGLGNRNLVFLMVMLNSCLERKIDTSLKVIALEEPEAHLGVSNVLLMASFIQQFKRISKSAQLFYSTHNVELINKLGLDNVVVINNGVGYSLKKELAEPERQYISNNPNTDILKVLFSKKTILVEGITEELLIKAYLQTKPELNDIKVVSFHKGFKSIINIWKKVNHGSKNKLGVVRDSDDQINAQKEHDNLQDSQIIIRTTEKYTLETEIVSTGNNYSILLKRYGDDYGWSGYTEDQLQEDWRSKKTNVILRICEDLLSNNLEGFSMPKHIQEILDFMME